jgi:hypothetical protein
LRTGALRFADLKSVQRRREWPTKITQGLQVLIQKHVIEGALASASRPAVPWVFKLFNAFPILRRIPARLMGLGVRPEHVRTPEVRPTA